MGLSLVDVGRRTELLYLCAHELHLSSMRSALEHDVQLAVGRAQLDSQQHDATFPVIFLGEPGADAHAPWLQCNATKRRLEKRLKRTSIAVQEVQLQVEESLLYALHAFARRGHQTL